MELPSPTAVAGHSGDAQLNWLIDLTLSQQSLTDEARDFVTRIKRQRLGSNLTHLHLGTKTKLNSDWLIALEAGLIEIIDSPENRNAIEAIARNFGPWVRNHPALPWLTR